MAVGKPLSLRESCFSDNSTVISSSPAAISVEKARCAPALAHFPAKGSFRGHPPANNIGC